MPRDMYAPHRRVTVPTVDRQAWAAEVRSLIKTAADGNTAEFARMTGTDRRTVNRWKAQTIDVTHESVMRVARACNVPAADLLVKAGLLEHADLKAGRR